MLDPFLGTGRHSMPIEDDIGITLMACATVLRHGTKRSYAHL